MDGLLALGCALVFASSVPAQTNGAVAAAEGQRFLFVVDTSSSMRKIDDATRQAIFDLIYFGIGGQMKKGDTFGIWTFNEKTYAGQVPMQTWDPEKVLVQASLAAKYLQAQKFEGESMPQNALARAGAIVRNVKDLNILMITDGQEPLAGTAFDHQVNPVYEQREREREKLKRPFVTTFIARGGQVTNASVAIAGEAILIPPPSPTPPREIVLRPKSPGTNVARVTPRVTRIRKTNSTPLIIRANSAPLQAGSPPAGSSSSSIEAVTQAPSPIVHPADYIGSNEALGLTSTAHPATNAAPPSPEPVTNAAPAVQPAAAVSTLQPPAPVTTTTLAATTQALASQVIRMRRPTNAASGMFADLPVAAREVQSSYPAAGQRSGLSPAMLIGAGILLLAGSAGLLVFGLRRTRAVSHGPSVISQSMERR